MTSAALREGGVARKLHVKACVDLGLEDGLPMDPAAPGPAALVCDIRGHLHPGDRDGPCHLVVTMRHTGDTRMPPTL